MTAISPGAIAFLTQRLTLEYAGAVAAASVAAVVLRCRRDLERLRVAEPTVEATEELARRRLAASLARRAARGY